MKKAFISSLLFFSISVYSFSATLFQDNFEDWTTYPGSWGSAVPDPQTSSMYVTTQTAIKYTGNYGLIAVDNGNTQEVSLIKTLTSGNTEYCQVFAYWVEVATTSAGKVNKIVTVRTTAGTSNYSFRLVQTKLSGAAGVISLQYLNNVGTVVGSATGTPAPVNGVWYCYQFQFPSGMSSPTCDWWIDGVKQTAVNTGVDWTGRNTRETHLGTWLDQTTDKGTTYFDDFTIDDAYISSYTVAVVDVVHRSRIINLIRRGGGVDERIIECS